MEVMNSGARKVGVLRGASLGLAGLGVAFVLTAVSGGVQSVQAGDPAPVGRPDFVPTVVVYEPTEVPVYEPTEVPEEIEIEEVVAAYVAPTATATPTRVPATPTPAPVATVQQQVVAGVSALPRTGGGDSAASGTNWGLLVVGSGILAASAGAGIASVRRAKTNN